MSLRFDMQYHYFMIVVIVLYKIEKLTANSSTCIKWLAINVNLPKLNFMI